MYENLNSWWDKVNLFYVKTFVNYNFVRKRKERRLEERKHMMKRWHHTTVSNFSAFMTEHCPARFISPDPFHAPTLFLSLYKYIHFNKYFYYKSQFIIWKDRDPRLLGHKFPSFSSNLQKCPPELLKFFLFPPRALKTQITSVSSRSRSRSILSNFPLFCDLLCVGWYFRKWWLKWDS